MGSLVLKCVGEQLYIIQELQMGLRNIVVNDKAPLALTIIVSLTYSMCPRSHIWTFSTKIIMPYKDVSIVVPPLGLCQFRQTPVWSVAIQHLVTSM